MSEMVERVAMALDPDAFADWQMRYQYSVIADGPEEARKFADYYDATNKAREKAKLIINAMRETNGGMRSAGCHAARAHTSYFDNQVARLVYEAMIDEALKEGP